MWTVIGKTKDSSEAVALAALNQLCTIYWLPIYTFIRHTGATAEEAEDLTQGYFLYLLGRGYIGKASREVGKFRAFLIADLKHYLSNEWRRGHTLKRGGRVMTVPIQTAWAEENYGTEPVDNVTPEVLFDRKWANVLLARVMNALREQYAKKHRLEVFEALRQFISWNAGEESYTVAAEKLGRSVADVKINVHRLRKAYREILEAEVSHTVSSPDDIAAEIRHLAASLC